MTRPLPRTRPGLRPLVAFILALAFVGLGAPTAGADNDARTRPSAARTVVSLTFDDGAADQRTAARMLDAVGVDGTFYATTGWIDKPGFLSRADLSSMHSRGHEIGGHTKTHRDLAQLPESEIKRQICDDRKSLEDWGFAPTSFAYPFASSTPQVAAATDGCGYDTARGLGDVRSPGSCADCDPAETLPAADSSFLAAPDQVDSSWTLRDLQNQVTRARSNGGGWVILTFHNICNDIGSATCPASQSIRPATFAAFATWLRLLELSPVARTTTATVGDAYRASVGSSYPGYRPAHAEQAPSPVPAGTNAVVNPSLEGTDAVSGDPACFERGGYGARDVAWSRATGRTGSVGQQVTVTGYQSGDAKLLQTMDLGSCAPAVAAGHSYDLGAWYTSTGLTQFALYYRNASGEWKYWTSSPWFAPETSWTEATWTTPPVPADATAVSFGLALIEDGTLVTDDYTMVDPGSP